MVQVSQSTKFFPQKNTITTVTTANIGRDFSLFNSSLTFVPGSSDGDEMCSWVTVHIDNLVESDEDFVVNLSLVTPMGTSFSLGNTETTVTLTDNECTLRASLGADSCNHLFLFV